MEKSLKVPAITLGFWIIKILATTLGETGGDAVSMTLNLGYLAGTAIFAAVFLVAISAQIAARTFNPWLYWATIVATTTVGTTMADFATRSMGIGYVGGSLILAALLAASLSVWYFSLGSVSVETVSTRKGEAFYWVTIMFSQTLGTALGDFAADSGGLGFGGGAILFGAMLAVIAALYAFSDVSRTALFWGAFILTRPLGATVGDLLDKSHAQGGLELGRFSASAVLIGLMIVLVFFFPNARTDETQVEGRSDGRHGLQPK